MSDKTYPHESGDVIVIGPGCIASKDEKTIIWKGESYSPDLANDQEQGLTEGEWMRMWKMADDRYDALCMNTMRAIAMGGSLEDILDIVGNSMTNCDHIDDESAGLFNKAQTALERSR